MDNINNEKKTTYSTYIIGKKKYNVTLTANTPSNNALKNFASEILK